MFKKIRYALLVFLSLAIIAGASPAAPNISDIQIGPGEVKDFTSAKPIERVLSANPRIAVVQKLSSDTFRIKGTGTGKTYIYFWWTTGSLSVIKAEISETYLPKKPAVIEKERDAGDSLKFEYVNSTYGGNSDSQYVNNTWAYSGSFSGLRAWGQTPFGKTDSYVHYEGYNGQYGVTRFSLNSAGGGYYFSLGDADVNFSDLSLPYTHLQGLYYKNTMIKWLELTLAGGARGNGLWGKDAMRDSRPSSQFAGLKATLKPAHFLQMDLNAVMASSEPGSVQRKIVSAAMNFRPFNILDLGGEYAVTTGQVKAWQADASLNTGWMYVKGLYRDVPAEFVTPSDLVTVRGEKGYFINASIRPGSFLRLSADYNRYVNRYLQAAGNDYENYEMRGSADFNLGQRTSFSLSPWKQDRQGYPGGGYGEGYSTQFTHSFKMLGDTTIYARYEPSKYTMAETSEADYTYDRTSAGIKMQVTEAVDITFENEWNTRTSLFTNTADSGNLFKIIMNYDSNIGRTPFYATVNGHYYGGNDLNGIMNEVYGDAEIGYRTDDFNVYVRGKTADYSGSAANPIDRNEKHINFGLKAVFDTDRVWAGSGTVMGIVFVDENADGIKQTDEAAIADARIVIGGKTYSTDSMGRYRASGIPAGQASVALDLGSVGPGYILTTQSPRMVKVAGGSTSRADFGVRGKSGILITVFRDKDRNGKLGKSEKPVPGIAIMVDGRQYNTDAEGKIAAQDLTEGRHTVSIVINRLPKGMVPDVPTKLDVTIKGGKTEKVLIPMVGQ